MDITGRKLFVRALQEEGVDTIFGYPGGMVTDVMDELYKQQDIRLFHRLRSGIMGNTMNLPGRSGRKISIAAYKISQKVVGFN